MRKPPRRVDIPTANGDVIQSLQQLLAYHQSVADAVRLVLAAVTVTSRRPVSATSGEDSLVSTLVHALRLDEKRRTTTRTRKPKKKTAKKAKTTPLRAHTPQRQAV